MAVVTLPAIVSLGLFTEVRMRRIFGSSNAECCISPPLSGRGHRLCSTRVPLFTNATSSLPERRRVREGRGYRFIDAERYSEVCLGARGEDLLLRPYTSIMADEDTVLEEAMDDFKEAGLRIRVTQSLLMRSQGMTEGEGIITFVDGVLEEMESAYRYLDNEESDN
jgi:hypothetical protein